MMKDKREQLYDNLIQSGKVTEDEIGTLNDFRSAIKDEKTAKEFHKNLLTVFSPDEVGDENAFYNSIADDFSPNAPVTDADKQNYISNAKAMMDQTKRQEKDFNQRVDNMQEYGLGLDYGKTKKGKKQFNSQTGQYEDTFITAIGNRHVNKLDADTESLQYMKYMENLERHRKGTGYVEGFIPGIKQGWNSLVEGAKYLAGETANVFTGSSLDDAQALDEITRLEKEGVGLDEGVKPLAELERKYHELVNNDINSNNKDITEEQRFNSQEAIKRDNIHSYIREVLEESGGDWDKAKQLLTERAADKSWGDEVIQNASEEMNKAKPTKGFGAWIGNLIPQMAPSAAAIALSFVTKNPKYAKMVGGLGMGGMTASTAGQSMKEARDAGATNGQTWAVGIADGIIEFATEKIPYDRYTSRLFNGTKKKVAKDMAEAVTNVSSSAKNELETLLRKANDKLGGKLFSKENAKKYLTDIAAEGASEFTAEALQTITPMIYQSPEEYPAITEILQNGWEGAKAGLFMGAVLGGASKGSEYHQNRQRRKEQGFVDVAEIQFSDKDMDIAEIVGKDAKGNLYAMRDGEVQTVSPDQVVQAHHYTFDEFENGRIEIEADEAWDEGYNASNAPDMQDVKNSYEIKRAELAEQMGVESEILDDEIGDPLSFIQEQRNLGKSVDELQSVIDYTNAKYAYDGMQQKASDDVESQVTASNSDIDSRTSKTDGMVHPAVMKVDDRQVFIVDGVVNMTTDGTMVDTQSSDESIIVKDATTGEVSFASPSDVLNVEQPIDASLQKITEEQRIRNEYQQKFDDDVNGRITQFNAGDPYTLTDENGNQTVVTLASDENGFVENPDGTVNIVREGGKDLEQMPKDELQQMFDNTNKKRAADQENERKRKKDEAAAKGNEPVNIQVEPTYQENDEMEILDDDRKRKKAIVKGRRKFVKNKGLVPDKNGEIVEYQVEGEDDTRHGYANYMGNMVVSYKFASPAVEKIQGIPSDDTSIVENNAANEVVEESEISDMPESALQRVPKDEKGNPLYEDTDNDTAWDAILEQTDGDEDMATTVAEAMLSDKEAELKKLEKVKAKGGVTIAEKIASEKERKAAIAKAQSSIEAWKRIAETGKQRRRAFEAEKQKALHDEAVKQVEAEREAKKIADAERAAVGNENPMPAISEKWNTSNRLDGMQDEIVLPNGERVKGHYVLHESGSSSASHQANNGFHKTEGFPMDESGNTVNDRDYEGDSEAQRVTRDIADNYDQRALQTPVVVSQDGVVLSGNGRTMAGEMAAMNGTDSAYNDYLKQYAAKYGFTPEQVEQMQHPRVAFVPDESMPYTSETFAKFNQQEMKSQSKTEHAVKMGKTVSDDTFNKIIRAINRFNTLGDFYNDSSAGLDAISELVNTGIISQAQVAEMEDGDKLSAVGRETLENVLIGKSFEGDPNAVRMLTEVPSMRQSVIFALSEISNNLSLGEDFTLKNELTDAIKLCYEARVQGKMQFGDAVSLFARQGNLFASPEDAQTVADYQNATIMMLADVLNDKRVSQLKKVIASYNDMAVDSANGQLDLFTGELKNREEIIENVFNLLNNGTKEQIEAAQQAAVERRKETAREGVSKDGDVSQGDAGEQVDKAALKEKGKPARGRKQLEKAIRNLKEAKNLKEKTTAISTFMLNVERGAVPTEEETALIEQAKAELEGKTFEKPFMKGNVMKFTVKSVDENGIITYDKEYKGKVTEEKGDIFQFNERLGSKAKESFAPIVEEGTIFRNRQAGNAVARVDGSGIENGKRVHLISYAENIEDLENNLLLGRKTISEEELKSLIDSKTLERSDSQANQSDKPSSVPQHNDQLERSSYEKTLSGLHEGVEKGGIPNLDAISKRLRQLTKRINVLSSGVATESNSENVQKAFDAIAKLQGEIKALKEFRKEVKAKLKETEESTTDTLTETEVRATNLDQITKDGAISYINGNVNFATSIAYQTAYNYVRNRTKSTEPSSDTGSRTLVASTVPNDGPSASGPSGRGTERVVVQPSTKGSEQGESKPSVSGTEDSSSDTSGKQGDTKVGGKESTTDGVSSGDTGSKRSGKSSGKGNDVSKPRSKRSSRKSVAKDDGGKFTAERNAAIDEINGLLDDFIKAGQEGLSVSVLPFNAKQLEIAGKLLIAGVKLGYTYIKEGIYNFNEWKDKMYEKLYIPFTEVMKLTDAQVDEFISDMWNYPFTIGEETRLLKEWASIMEREKLRSAVRDKFADKREAQKAAENIPVKVGDMSNIVDTLPFLLPQQQEDVRKAEAQFFDSSHQDREHGNGKGYLFTNGTGTGKTYTGLGIIKRFVKQGKGRILILTPSQAKVSDWIEDAKNLGINVTALESTKDKGKGVVITTFANLRTNADLMQDAFDLIVYDESHRIMENKSGTETIGAKQHYMLSNKNVREAIKRLKVNDPFFKKLSELTEEFKVGKEKLDKLEIDLSENRLGPDDLKKLDALEKRMKEVERQLDEMQKEVEKEEARLKPLAEEAVKRTKVVFLSATPFNTVESLAYTEGYIFSYPEENQVTIGSYNHRNPREDFLERNFGAGYRFRYGRIEKHVENPEALSQQEIQFSDYLENQLETKSGRIIDSEFDYSRDFPAVTLDMAPLFNKALQDVFGSDSTLNVMSEAFRNVFFDYNYSTALFETMKISAIMPRIKEHLAMGRKVVIFHRRKASKLPIQPPFTTALAAAQSMANETDTSTDAGLEAKKIMLEAISEFKRKYAKLLEYERKLDYSMPREQIAQVFGPENVLYFSGSESKKVKNEAIKQFNDNDSGKNIIVIQEASGKEGISLHDTTGKHQRVLITLALPQSPITALQIEGRIYRIGNKSNAIFEYPLLGLNLETTLFGEKFNQQVSTTENLALGSKARNLRQSFAEGVLSNTGDVPLDKQGVGGKAFDNEGKEEIDEFDKSVLDYYGTQKLKGKRDERAGFDYFPTPEPVGYKMVEWAKLEEGDEVLEPSAGHGAIARYVPRTNSLTAVEPSDDLFSTLQLRAGGQGRKFISSTFENLDVKNKYDVVLMNPPYGTAGRMAIDHLAKAFNHLTEGGRVIAIIPRGSTDKKFDKWYEEQESAVMVGEVLMPSVTFGRAGTSVSTRIVVIDKVTRKEAREKAPYPTRVDLTYVENVDKEDGLFETLRDIDMPRRTVDKIFLNIKNARKTRRDFADNKLVYLNNITEEGIRIGASGCPPFNVRWEDLTGDNAIRTYQKFYAVYDFYDREGKSQGGLSKREENQLDYYATVLKTIQNVSGKSERDLREGNLSETTPSTHKQEQATQARTTQAETKPNTEVAKKVSDSFKYMEETHTKTGATMHMVKSISSTKNLSAEQYKAIAELAKKHGGYWNRTKKGFHFKTKEEADAFMGESTEVKEMDDDVLFRSGDEIEYTEEEQQIIDKAINNGTYLKAPNGKPTNLSPKQWVQVRTSNFKNWFGDWELPTKIIDIVKAAKIHGFKNFAEARKWAKENIVRIYSDKETGGKGEIRISSASVEKFLSESAIMKSDTKDVHLSTLKVLPEIIKNGIIAESHRDYIKGSDGYRRKENGVNPNVTIHRVYGAITIEDQLYRVKITLKEELTNKDPKKAYSYEAIRIELLAGQSGDAVTSPRNSNNSISATKLLKGVEKSYKNGEYLLDHSKVVDENGEPLVVYHGTSKAGFYEFDVPSQLGKGLFSTDNKSVAMEYAGSDQTANAFNDFDTIDGAVDFLEKLGSEVKVTRDNETNELVLNIDGIEEIFESEDDLIDYVSNEFGSYAGTYHNYLNSKSPLIVDAKGSDWKSIPFNEGKWTSDALVKYAIQNDYDGLIVKNVADRKNDGEGILNDYVVFDPNQIKSATDNNGEFSTENNDIRFRIRKDPAPKKTGIGYKVFVLKDGKLYPPMVANPNAADTPVGIWLDADAAPIVTQSKTGRNKVKAGGKGTQGGSGTLAYRPGWHLGEIPYALQFNRGEKMDNPMGVKGSNGKVLQTGRYFPKNFVWAEVEYANDVDYQKEAESYGMNPSGNFQHSLAGLPHLPTNGSYRYKTNPNPATDPWIITGAMRVNKILTPSEVDKLVKDAGRKPQEREEGAVTDQQIEDLNKQIEERKGEITSVIDRLSNILHTPVRVITDVNEIPEEKSRRRKAKGWFNPRTGEVVVVLPNATSVDDMAKTMLHEIVAHKGLRQLFGKDFDTFLDNVLKNASEPVYNKIVEMAAKNGWSFPVATEEYLASLAETTNFEEAKKQGWWNKVKDFFMDLLAKAGIKLEEPLTDNELRYILWRSYENLKNGPKGGPKGGFFSIAEDIVKRIELKLGEYSDNSLYRSSRDKKIMPDTGKQSEETTVATAISSITGTKILKNLDDAIKRYENVKGSHKSRTLIGDLADSLGIHQEDKSSKYATFETANGKTLSIRLSNHNATVSNFDKNGEKEGLSIVIDRNANKGIVNDGDAHVIEYFYAEKDLNRADSQALVEIIKSLKQALYSGEYVDKTGLAKREEVNNYNIDDNEGDLLFRGEEPTGPAVQEYNHAVRTPNKSGSVKASKNLGYRLQEAYQDSMLALKKLQEAIAHETGKKVNDFENAYMAENRMSSINNAEKEVYMRDYMRPIFDAVSNLLSDGKSTLDDINNYLMAKHGLERNEYFRDKAAREAADKWANDTIKAEMAKGKSEDEANQIADEGKQAIYDETIESLQDADYSGLTELTQLENEEVNEDFTQRAEKMVADFEDDYDVTTLWDTIRAATNESLKKSYNSGMLSLENYEYIKNMFEYYVPLRGWDNNEAGKEYDYLTNNRMHLSPAVVKMKGRKSKADNVLAFIGFSGESSIIQGNRNKMKQHLLNLVVNHPTDLARASKQWYVLDNATGEWEERYPDFPNNATPEQVNAIVDSFEEKMLDLKDKGLAKQGRINLSTGMHIKRSEQPEHTVKVMRNGQPMNVYINGNPRAAQAVNGILNPDNVFNTKFHRMAQEVKSFMAKTLTSWSPIFVIRNLVMDNMWSSNAIYVKENKTYSKQFRKNLMKILLSWKTMPLLRKFENGTLDENNEFEKYFKEFLMNGGETGFTAINTVEDYKRDINRYVEQAQKGVAIPKKAWRKFWDSVEFMNRAAEDVSRFATYMTSRQQGRSIERSIWDAKEVTVNFNKKGSGEFGARYFNFAYVFFNAAIQSISNFASLAYKHPGKMGKTAGKFVSYGMLLPAYSILASMLMGDDDEDKDAYFDLPKWVRENHLVIYIPFSDRKFITIPIPHELRPFYAIGENALCAMMGKEEPEDALKSAALSFTSLFPLDLTGHGENWWLNFVPTIGQPPAEIAANKDFFGKPIYKDSPFNQLKPEWQRAYAGTNPYLINGMKILNELGGGNNVDKGYWMTDINPAKIEHLFEGYLGGMGKFINKTANFVSMAWDEDSRLMRNVPVVGSFVQDADPRFSRSNVNSTYYSHKEELQEMQHKISGYRKEMKMAYAQKDEAELEKYSAYLKDFFKQSGVRYNLLKDYVNKIDGLRGAKEFVGKDNQKKLDKTISSLQRELDSKLDDLDQ